MWRAVVFALCYCSPVLAQPLLLDPGFPNGSGPGNYVRSIVALQDGRILVGGNFTNFNGKATGAVVRLYPDGSLDENFKLDPITSTQGSVIVQKVALLTDGRVLLDGSFTHIGAIPSTNIAVLTADGRLAPGFRLPDLLPPGSTYTAAYPALEGGLWVTGSFTTFVGPELRCRERH